MPKYITDTSGLLKGKVNRDAGVPASLYLKSSSSVWMLELNDSGSLVTTWVRELDPRVELLFSDWISWFSPAMGGGQLAAMWIVRDAQTNGPDTHAMFASLLGVTAELSGETVDLTRVPFPAVWNQGDPLWTGSLSSATASYMVAPGETAGLPGAFLTLFSPDLGALYSSGSFSPEAAYFFWRFDGAVPNDVVMTAVTGVIPADSPYQVTVTASNGRVIADESISVWNVSDATVMEAVGAPPAGDIVNAYYLRQQGPEATIMFSPADAAGGVAYLIGFREVQNTPA